MKQVAAPTPSKSPPADSDRLKDLMGKIGHKKRKQKAKEGGDDEGGEKATRTQRLLNRAKKRPH